MAITPLPPFADAETVSAFAAVFAGTPDAHAEPQVNHFRSWCENETTLFEASCSIASPTHDECQHDGAEEEIRPTLPKLPKDDFCPAVLSQSWPLGGPEAEPSPVLKERSPLAEPSPTRRERLSAVEGVQISPVMNHTFVADTGLDITFSKTPSLTEASRRRLSRSISPITIFTRQKSQPEQAETDPLASFLQPPRSSPRQANVCPRSVSPIKVVPRKQGSCTAKSPGPSPQSPAAMEQNFGPEAEPSPVLAEAVPRARMPAAGRVHRASTYDLSSATVRSPRRLQRRCSADLKHSKTREDDFFGKDTRESLLAIHEKVAKYEQLLDQLDLALKQPEKDSDQDCSAGASLTERCLELAAFLQRLSAEERDLLRFMPLSRWSHSRRRELRHRCMTRGLNFGRRNTDGADRGCIGPGRHSWAAQLGAGAVDIVRGTLISWMSRKADEDRVMASP